MLQKLKKRIKNQRGMTLVELLAVIVILGIISAIAVPSIGGLINNTKKDAHIANAQQMVSAARMAVSGSDSGIDLSSGTATVKLSYLESQGYLETVDNPSDKTNGYNKDTSVVKISKNISTGSLSFTVTLIQGGTGTNPTTYFSDANTKILIRSQVNL
jgi:type IV pilus assembly protein PilA